jgi:hypothetical protein
MSSAMHNQTDTNIASGTAIKALAFAADAPVVEKFGMPVDVVTG